MKALRDTEPPSRGTHPFLIGRNCRGQWVVCEENGVRGGLFVNQAEALRYIRSENDNQACPAVAVLGVLELTIPMPKRN